MGDIKGENREKGREIIFEEIVAKKFPNLMKNINYILERK